MLLPSSCAAPRRVLHSTPAALRRSAPSPHPCRRRSAARAAMSTKPEQIDALFVKLKAKMFAAAPELTVDELLRLQASGAPVRICDTRTAEEYDVSCLPGAQRKESVANWAKHADNAKVVCVCTVGARSGVACLALRSQGVDAVNLRGGILAWTHAEQPLVKPATGEPTNRVHCYSADWCLQKESYEPVVFARPPRGRTLLSMLRDKLASAFSSFLVVEQLRGS